MYRPISAALLVVFIAELCCSYVTSARQVNHALNLPIDRHAWTGKLKSACRGLTHADQLLEQDLSRLGGYRPARAARCSLSGRARRSRTRRGGWFAACARGCRWRTLACAQVQQPSPAVRRSTAT